MPKPRWASELPEALQYLAEPAERYSHYQTAEERTKFMLQIAHEQAEDERGEMDPRAMELYSLAQQLAPNRAELNAWVAARLASKQPGGSAIQTLLDLLEDFYPGDAGENIQRG
jgi:hypothetical protein